MEEFFAIAKLPLFDSPLPYQVRHSFLAHDPDYTWLSIKRRLPLPRAGRLDTACFGRPRHSARDIAEERWAEFVAIEAYINVHI